MAQRSNNIPKGSSPLRNLQGQLIGYTTPAGQNVYFEASEGEPPIKPQPINPNAGVPLGGRDQEEAKRLEATRLRRFRAKKAEVGAQEFNKRREKAIQLLIEGNYSREEALSVINLKINPNKVAQKFLKENPRNTPLQSVPPPQAPEPVDSEPAVVEPVTTPDEPVEPAPVQAAAITKPQTNRQLMVAEAKRKYKDSPFKQWAHANQKLAMAVRPGQAGYAQVQEYLKESGLLKTKDLQIKSKDKKQDSFLNIEQLQFNPGQARGADGFTEGERRFVRPLPRSQQVDTPGMGMAMADPLRGYTG